jgi:hypothetical protein
MKKLFIMLFLLESKNVSKKILHQLPIFFAYSLLFSMNENGQIANNHFGHFHSLTFDKDNSSKEKLMSISPLMSMTTYCFENDDLFQNDLTLLEIKDISQIVNY